MKCFIMTGAPGSGKTSILRALENLGYAVVEEAATDVVAAQQAQGNSEPWNDPLFIDAIVRLQEHRRQEQVRRGAAVQVHDRSPVCTLALARYLGHPVTAELSEAIARITAGCSLSGRSASASQPRPARSATTTRWRLNVSTRRSICAPGSSSWTSWPVQSRRGLR